MPRNLDNMKHRYSILSTIIETDRPIDCLQEFECKDWKDDLPLIILETQDNSKENQCYGIQYISQKQTQCHQTLDI